MKLQDLKSVLSSNIGNVQLAIVYEWDTDTDLENGCSVEYAIVHYGERIVKRIQAYQNYLVITV